MNSNSRDSLLRESRPIRIAGLFLSLGLVAVILYSNTLPELFSEVLRREGSSHGLFVPLLSLCFVWRRRNRLREIEPSYDIIPGLGVLADGLLLFSLAKAHDCFFWECFSFVIIISGLGICFFWEGLFEGNLIFVLFLAAMIPVPWQLYKATPTGSERGR